MQNNRLGVGCGVQVKTGHHAGMVGEVAEVDYSFGGGGDVYRVRLLVDEGEAKVWMAFCFFRKELTRRGFGREERE
jgi:hypothetical protein